MNYDEFTPYEAAVTIVFGGTPSERDAFQAAFLKKYPAFRTEMHPCLEHYKKPLLGGQKPIIEYLAKQAKKGERGLTAQQLEYMIMGSAECLRIDHVIDRYVPALSSRQKFLFSLILDECSQVSRSVFVRDDHHRLTEGDCVIIADWFTSSCGSDSHIVLLAGLPMEKVPEYLHLAEQAAFYQMEQDQLTPYDIAAACARYKKADRHEKARVEQIGGEGFDKGDSADQENIYTESMPMFEKAAESGDVKSQIYCGNMYFYGKKSVQTNVAKALYWYEKAAAQGNAEMQFQCGIMYDKGVGTAVNKAKALYWLEKAAMQGDRDSQYLCGSMYFKGEGTHMDRDKAKMWWQKAAAQGKQDAKDMLKTYFS